MSEVKLNLIDQQQILCGTIHGSVADAAIAALSAEPETLEELEAALTRFIKPLTANGEFALFLRRDDIDTTPWDAGIVVIDLASRTVAVESTYSSPASCGEIQLHDGNQQTDVAVPYRLADDWLFVYSINEYHAVHEQRKKERDANPPFDARAVLYGRPLLKWIAETINSSEGVELWRRLVQDRARLNVVEQSTETPQLSPDLESDLDTDTNPISVIHARWLMTPRDDLRGQSPRDVFLATQDLIDYDLNSRELQWSFCDEGPPCLSVDSFSYRFAGFGTHEWVIYYDLVRHLIWSALLCQSLSPGGIEMHTQGDLPTGILSGESLEVKSESIDDVELYCVNAQVDIDIAITQLDEIKTAWLERPQHDYDSRTPAILISNERKRLPIALQPRDMIVDENCPTCQMFADESALGLGVGFWHLDGCNMDDDFAFSHFQTREGWEAERREWAEFSKTFNREWEERQQRIASGEIVESEIGWIGRDPF
jgi:hypothetical protein